MNDKWLIQASNAPGTAFFLLDAGLRILDQSDMAAETTGLFPGEVVGKHLADVAPLSELAATLQGQMQEDGSLGRISLPVNHRSLEFLYRLWSISDETGGPAVYGLFLTDVTPVFMTTDGLVQGGKKSSLITSVVRHDIQNQITALLGYIELSLDLVPDSDDEMKTFLERCLQSAITIQRQVTYTREFKELGVADPCWTGLHEIIAHAVEERAAVQGRVTNNADYYEVFADITLQKAFVVLLDISFRNNIPDTTVRLSTREENGRLVIEYRDECTGNGEATKPAGKTLSGRPYGLRVSDMREVLLISGFELSEKTLPGNSPWYEVSIPCDSYRLSKR